MLPEFFIGALGIETFVNADYIARGLSGRNTDAVNFEAGRIMLKRLRQLADAGVGFAFESTLSSRTFVPFLRGLKALGYSIAVYYFALTNAQLAVCRVKLRVALGGHHVPSHVVKRRFERSLNNFFKLYASIADEWTLFDNAGSSGAKQVASNWQNQLQITDQKIW